MIGKILGGLAALIVVVIALGFVLPDRVTMQREITIDASPEDVFAHISDFKAWEHWSPWAKLDPDAEYTLAGSGLGQKMAWRSDDPNVGNGSQEITAIEAPTMVTTHLEFEGMGVAQARFDITPKGNGTHVVWSFESNMREGVPLYMKPVGTYMGYFMDGMLGPQYEEGLKNLKQVAEQKR